MTAAECSEAAAGATADDEAAAEELPASLAFSEAANEAPMENLELSAEAKPERPPVELLRPEAEWATGVEGLPETPRSAEVGIAPGAVAVLWWPALLLWSRLLRAAAHELTLAEESCVGRVAAPTPGTKGGIEGAEWVKGTAFEAFLSLASIVDDAGLGAVAPSRKERLSSGAEGREEGVGAAHAAGAPQSEGLACDAVEGDCAAAMG